MRGGLTDHGWNVSLLTKRLSLSVDHSTLEVAFPGRILRTPFSGAYAAWMDTHDWLRRANRALWKLRGKANYARATQFGWAVKTAGWAKHAWRAEPPDVVWTVSSSNLSSAIAGRYLSHVFARPLVVELHDPPLYPGRRASNSEIQRAFQRCIRASSAIVTTTAAYARHLRDEYKLPPERVVPIYLSYRGGLIVPAAPPCATAWCFCTRAR